MPDNVTPDIPAGLKLRRVRIRGFKALADIDVHVPRDILILIGGNGAGKSSVLQALALVQYVAKGHSAAFFSDRGWDPADVRTQIKSGLRSGVISYRILLESRAGKKLYWHFWWHLAKSRMELEEVWVWKVGTDAPERILKVSANTFTLDETDIRGIRPEGSVLGILDPDAVSPEIAGDLASIRQWGNGILSLELLNPVDMRRGARGVPVDIGPRGERLGGFLASLGPEQKSRLVARIAEFYPLTELTTTRKRAGWIDLQIAERFTGAGRINASHMSDGFMRLLGLASIPEFGGGASTVLLDEVEDGIEPHVLSKFIHLISRESNSQMILTSHSPVLVNDFDPQEIAFAARGGDGGTEIASFRSIAGFADGLQYFGPGELWTNTEMSAINRWVLEASNRTDVDRLRSESTPAMIKRFMSGG